mmetsp:Transcript_15902/g.24518  ORF Transcript_15902/g.24518 Transcript_15902/m.24518 type:complete len:80 (+) Transcript_15902:1749-1988(+)
MTTEQVDDLASFKPRRHQTNFISVESLPKYVQDEISVEQTPYLALDKITEFKSGLKIGSKIKDTTHRWVEKWYEARCKD